MDNKNFQVEKNKLCEYKNGDILKGSNRHRDAAFHYIVFLEGSDIDSFIGAVLTHSNGYEDNILMKKKHFKKVTPEGGEFEFKYESTHLVKGRFIKLNDWGPLEKIGELTQAGINFVEFSTNGFKPILWESKA